MADDDDYHGQTAPESSYLFDPIPTPTTAKKPAAAKDKRRSSQALISSSSSSSRGESSQQKSRQQVRHQRSQSATPDMFSNVNNNTRRNNNNNGPALGALGALNEEDKDNNAGTASSAAAPVVPEDDAKKKQNPNRRQSRTITGPRPQDIPGIGPLPAVTISASAASGSNNNKSEAMESLQDIISTLKNLPPISVKKQDNTSADPTASTSSSSTGGRRANHRKQQSMSSISFSRSSGGQNSDLSAIAEDRSLDSKKDGKRQSYGGNNVGAGDRMSSSSSTSSSKDKRTSRPPVSSTIAEEEESGGSKASARAEAEAKLMGTYKDGDGETDRSDRRRSTIEEIAKVNENRRRSMAATTVAGSVVLPPLPLSAEGLEQGSAQTLAQKSNRRISFNRPLNLSADNKGPVDNNQQHPQPQQSHSQPHQSSGGKIHQRRNSRGSYDGDWRASSSGPLSPHAPPFSPRTKQFSLSLIPLTPARTNFPRDDANPNARRPLFTAHLPFSALTPLVKSRQLIRGTLRINKRNRSDAYVTSDDLDGDIYICGSRDRNRALEGDVVAVKLVDVDKVLREKKEKEEAKLMRNGGIQRPRAVEEEDTEIVLGGDEDVEKVRPKYCGVIVAVLERQQGQLYSGQLTLLRPNNKRAMEEKEAEEKARQQGSTTERKTDAPRIVWFKPTDKRVPLIAIPIEQVPEGFVDHHDDYERRLFVGSIKRWPITSLHPFGTLERELGDVGNLAIESQAVLADYNVNNSEFPEPALKCLPTTPWTIPEKEISSRRDLRTWRIFTIDPSSASDLDDALSITQMEDGTTEVGVHIADVSYFIKPNTPLDKEARNRSISVYLVEQSVPMLPSALNEMCSLDPNADKLAFSVIWRLSPDAKIVDTWYGRTVIHSSARLTYDDVQAVIDGGSLPSTTVVGNSVSDIERDLLALHNLANKLSNARLQNGSLTLDRSKLEFILDPNTGNPIGVKLHTIRESESLIQEFMLLANMSVAQKISSGFPEQALLRRHDKPIERRINEFIKHAEKLGYKFDGSSSGKLQASLNSVQDKDVRLVLNLLCTKPMQRAKYFCTGTTDIAKYQHYSLNVPLYTHFTSPIRRYADIIVHRQLEATLAGEKRFYLDKDTVQKTAQYCNIKKDGAKNAQDASSTLYLCTYLHSLSVKSAPIIRDAIVVAVLDQAFDILVPEYGIEKRIHMDSLPLEGYKYSETRGTLRLYWKKGVQSQEASNLMEYNPHADDESDDESVGVDEEAIIAAMQEKGDNQESGHISELATVQESEEGADFAEVNDNPAAAVAVAIASSLESNGTSYQSTAPPSTTPLPSFSSTLPSARRASVAHSYNTNRRASTAQGVHDEENFSQTIKIFSQIKVCITVSVDQSPPSLKVLAVNPFM